MSLSVPLNLQSLHFRPATEAEKLVCWTRNHASWGGILSDMTDYLGRETLNGSQEITRDGQITYWVLSSLSSAPDEGVEEETIIAACETLKRPVIIKTRDAGISQEDCFAIASVFTDSNCRGQGAATVLLKRLAEWLDGEAGSRCSALFSDVGKEFYATRGGWKPYSSTQIEIRITPVTKGKSRDTSNWTETLASVEYLDRIGVEMVCAADIRTLQNTLETTELGEGAYARVIYLPTFGQACWHFGTEEYIGKIVHGKSPLTKGAKINNVAIYWTHDFGERKLVILRFCTLSATSAIVTDEVVALLLAAEKEAREWGFEQIIAWNPSKDIVDAARASAQEVKVYDREEDSIPSLRWRGQDGRYIEWYPIEKFAWC